MTQPENSDIWERLYTSQSWGRYPPEELVRFTMRNFGRAENRGAVRILEVGSGPGANLWFLAREGFSVAGIDGSPTAVEMATARLAADRLPLDGATAEVEVGDFSNLRWPDAHFDAVIDVESIYANDNRTIEATIAEIRRVLRPNGRFFGKMFGSGCSACGGGVEFEPNTWKDLADPPFANTGIVHFFDRDDLAAKFTAFTDLNLDTMTRSDGGGVAVFEEWIVTCRKDGA